MFNAAPCAGGSADREVWAGAFRRAEDLEISASAGRFLHHAVQGEKGKSRGAFASPSLPPSLPPSLFLLYFNGVETAETLYELRYDGLLISNNK